jgi:hypothetical protein
MTGVQCAHGWYKTYDKAFLMGLMHCASQACYSRNDFHFYYLQIGCKIKNISTRMQAKSPITKCGKVKNDKFFPKKSLAFHIVDLQ